MDSGKEHALPWYPPICETPNSFDSKFISPLLLKATMGISSPESSLTSFLTSLAKNSELAEIGQRILTATKSVTYKFI